MAETRSSKPIVGRCPALRSVLGRAARVARFSVPVLILGESGTGKELLARFIHERSARAGKPLVVVNCAAIPKDLLEAELFGAERGAFTGSVTTRVGAFERAEGGTLFLDEIGDLALEHQAKLLRAIQEGEVQRVGGTVRRVNVRIVAATHRDLRVRAAEGGFREDLYYRLAGYELHLPPLRERGRDILAIAKALLERAFPGKFFSREAQVLLLTHTWPGNVRELENVVQAAAIDAPGKRISEKILSRYAQRLSVTDSRLDREATVREIVAKNGRVTLGDVVDALAISRSTAFWILRALRDRGELVARGRGPATYYEAVALPQAEPPPAGPAQELLSRQQAALRLAAAQGRFTRRDYARAAGVPDRTAKRDLADLIDKGLLRATGRGKLGAYEAVPGLSEDDGAANAA